ncbi:MAG: hypothetical protein IPM29_09820 [Planctomycetes bacterium]|nr:hypothetical protein [Planctomycetota bacterium]
MKTLATSWIVMVCVSLAGCGMAGVRLAEAEQLYGRADYFQAWVSIQEAHKEAPDDPEVAESYERIRAAFLLARGRELVFENRDLEAIELFERLLVLNPDDETAAGWIVRARQKLATRAARHGDTLQTEGDLEGALLAYREAVDHEPDNPIAADGLARLAETWRHRRADARDHYLEGVRALAEQLFQQTRYHMLIALDKDPGLDEARGPSARARKRLLEDRFRAARAMEAKGFFPAALREYRELRDADAALSDIDARIARTEAEVRASQLADEGQMLALRGDFTAAREKLEQALGLTTHSQDEISEALVLVHERELDRDYTVAKDHEIQGELEDAVAVYTDIDQRLPGFRDVRARISELQIRVEEAKTAYDAGLAAEAAGDREAALGHFNDVLVYWPEYRDAAARAAALRVAPPGEAPQAPSGDDQQPPAGEPLQTPPEGAPPQPVEPDREG